MPGRLATHRLERGVVFARLCLVLLLGITLAVAHGPRGMPLQLLLPSFVVAEPGTASIRSHRDGIAVIQPRFARTSADGHGPTAAPLPEAASVSPPAGARVLRARAGRASTPPDAPRAFAARAPPSVPV